ncbi:MAG: hypothetical protein IAE94_12440 [Chthoniobacterales bacterium]|nr:hypothetical protein [Chthoniobacterales bacterium]
MKSHRAFRYILRYSIDPGFEVEARMEELVTFCRDAKVEEVMLLICAEELSPGHPTPEEVEPWIDMARTLRQRLAAESLAMSLNPWSTIFHNQRGRHLRPGQNFRRMVGENGVQSTVTVCPLCEHWQTYLGDLFARYASEISPSALWIEDDWRLHNHDKALGWGGCFCDVHMREFSRRVGESVDRTQLLKALLSPGRPHPWRSVWMDLSAETLLAPLQKVAGKIRHAQPGVRLGLMSSAPDMHSIEGRPWALMQETLGFQPAFLTRPHLPPYTQTHALAITPAVTRQTLVNLEGPLEIYPELENSPRCGLYSKSTRYSRWEMLHCAAFGSHGITINHFDMMGNGIALDPTFGRMLADAKPMLDALASLEIEDREAEGVQILIAPDVARYIELDAAERSMMSLFRSSITWSDVFYILGMAHGFQKDLSTVRPGQVTALCGFTADAFSDIDIHRLLGGSVLLDATSASILLRRGFGAWIGVQSGEWKSLEETGYSYEEIDEEETFPYGVARPRLCAQRCAARLLSMVPAGDTRVLSRIFTANHAPLWPGALLTENALGGRVVTLTYPVEPNAQFFMAFFNRFRREFLHRIVFELSAKATLAAIDTHPMHAYRYSTSKGILLAALNPLDDPAPGVTWKLPTGTSASRKWKHLTRAGNWQTIEPTLQSGPWCERLHFETGISALDGAFFLGHPISREDGDGTS